MGFDIDNGFNDCKDDRDDDFLHCLRSKGLKVAVVGISCSGKSTMVKSFLPNTYENHFPDEDDEDKWNIDIISSNMSPAELVKRGINHIIFNRRKPENILKCIKANRPENYGIGNISAVDKAPDAESIEEIRKSQNKLYGEVLKTRHTISEFNVDD